MRFLGTRRFGVLMAAAVAASFTLVTAGASAATFTIGSLQIEMGSSFPDPATWGMMLLSFGLIGSGVRARKRTVVLA